MLNAMRLMTRRKACPVCQSRTERVRTPRSVRWLKPLLGPDLSFRRCYSCRSWRGLVLAPSGVGADAAAARRHATPGPVVVLSDDPARVGILVSVLADEGHELVVCGKRGVDLQQVRGFAPRLVLVDSPPDAPAPECIETLRRTLRPIAVDRVPDGELTPEALRTRS